MLEFSVLSAVLLLVIVVVLYYYIYGGKQISTMVTTIPGPAMSDPSTGNLSDMAAAGSLHQYLINLHQQYGDIAHFWWGKRLVVSISSPELFKQNAKVFDKPAELFSLFQPLFTWDSVMYANGIEGRARHAAYSRCFSESTIKNYYQAIQESTDDFMQKVTALAEDDHAPLREMMFAFAIRTLLKAVYGESLKNEKDILKLKESYDIVWNDLEQQLGGEKIVEGSLRMETFKKECDNIHGIMSYVLKKAQENPPDDPDRCSFLDVILKLDLTEGQRSADMVGFFVGGLHTAGLLLTWCVYYLGSRPDVQEKAANEILENVGNQPLDTEIISKLVYLKQVIDETLRCSVLAPYAARCQDEESCLGGHIIPACTPVIHALGASMHDPNQWPQPEQFDPDRFNPDNRRKFPSFGFEPFGFAGKRKCPGYRFSLAESTFLLANLLRKFKVNLVPGQEVIPVHGLVTSPKEEIWVTFQKRE